MHYAVPVEMAPVETLNPSNSEDASKGRRYPNALNWKLGPCPFEAENEIKS